MSICRQDQNQDPVIPSYILVICHYLTAGQKGCIQTATMNNLMHVNLLHYCLCTASNPKEHNM